MLPSAPLLPATLGGPCSCLYLGVKSPPVLKTSRCEHRAAYCRPGPHTAPQQLRRMTAIARSSLTRIAASAATCLRTEPRCAHVDKRECGDEGQGRCGPGHLQLHLHTGMQRQRVAGYTCACTSMHAEPHHVAQQHRAHTPSSRACAKKNDHMKVKCPKAGLFYCPQKFDLFTKGIGIIADIFFGRYSKYFTIHLPNSSNTAYRGP